MVWKCLLLAAAAIFASTTLCAFTTLFLMEAGVLTLGPPPLWVWGGDFLAVWLAALGGVSFLVSQFCNRGED